MNPFSLLLKIFSLAFLVVLLSHDCLAAGEAEKTAAATPYPLSICVVSGDKLGVMGPPTIVQYKGTEIRFCCKDCVKDFEKDPEKYLKRLQTATATQAAPSASPKI